MSGPENLSDWQLDMIKRKQTAAYSLAFVALGITYASTGPTLPDLADAIGTSLTGMSSALAAISAGYLTGSLVAGQAYDRIRGNRLMALCFVAISLLIALIPSIPTLSLLVIVMFLLGMMQGMADVGGNTLLVWVHGENVGSYMNMLHFFFGVGATLSPYVIGLVLPAAQGLRWSYRFLAVSVLPAALLLWLTPSPDIRKPSHVTEDDQTALSGTKQARASVVLFAVFFFLYVGAESGFGKWIASYARATGMGDATVAANLTALFWGALTLGRLMSIPIGGRLRPKYILLGDLVGALISVSLIALFPGTRWLTWAGTFGAGLFMASIFPTTLSLAERHLRINAKMASWFFVGSSLGGLTLPWLIGRMFETIGPQVTLWAILVDVVVGCAVFAGLIGLLGRDRELQNV